MFAQDAVTFLADWGSPVSWAPSSGGSAVAGLMIFDQPAEEIDGGGVISSEYKVTFEASAWPGLKRDEQLVIQGEGKGSTYKLRTQPQALADGVFAAVMLSKVAP